SPVIAAMVAVELSAASTRPCCKASATVSLPGSDRISISGFPALLHSAECLCRGLEGGVDRCCSLEPAQPVTTRDLLRITLLHHDLVADDYIGDEIGNLRAFGGYIEAAHTCVDAIAEQCGNDTFELHAHHIRAQVEPLCQALHQIHVEALRL